MAFLAKSQERENVLTQMIHTILAAKFKLVAKLELGNAMGEAPASHCYWKQELPISRYQAGAW